jgi:hypothetical protein
LYNIKNHAMNRKMRSTKITLLAVGLGLLSLLSVRLHAAKALSANYYPNVGVAQINSPAQYSAIFVVSDIHGMYEPMLRLLQSARITDSQSHWAAGRSLLIVLGDSIDKGPNSIEVIDYWMQLSAEAAKQGGYVLHLLGNHEAEFLADPTDDQKATELLAELRSRGMSLFDMIDPSTPRGMFLRSMPVAARVGRWLFAHSGYISQGNFQQFSSEATQLLQSQSYINPFFTGDDSVLEMKKWWRADKPYRAPFEQWLSSNGFYGLVFGHMPEALNVIGSSAISRDGRLIKIDNGMAPEAGSHPGSVLVFPRPLDLTTGAPPHVWMLPAGSPSPQSLPVEAASAPSSASNTDSM